MAYRRACHRETKYFSVVKCRRYKDFMAKRSRGHHNRLLNVGPELAEDQIELDCRSGLSGCNLVVCLCSPQAYDCRITSAIPNQVGECKATKQRLKHPPRVSLPFLAVQR